MKRIFVAIPISEELPHDFARGLLQVKDIRWIEPKNLHVTLVPPWYAEEAPMAARLLKEGDSIPEIVKKLQTLQGKIKPFEIKFDRVSFGPNQNQPRLIWAEGQAPQALLNLKNNIENALEGVVNVSDGRQFYQHITLARFRSGDFKKFPVKKLNEPVNWKQTVDHIALFESHLSPHSADYEIIEKVKLT